MFDRKNPKDNPDAPAAPAAEPSKPAAKSPVPGGRSTAMIGSTVKILGEIISDENLVIEGEVEGTVTLDDHEVTIGPSGRIHANITAKVVKIDGMVDGDISGTEKVVISKSGNVRGNIVSPRVILEDGGQFKGSIDMGPGVSQARSGPSHSDFSPSVSSKPVEAEKPAQTAGKSG